MMLNKIDYIAKQFSRAEKKKFEHYVVTRIWHLLDDLSIKFITQQYVTRPSGRALTDIYFPQFRIHIEIDEKHHKKQNELDKLREVDIINATGHRLIRIDVTKDIEIINQEILQVVNEIKFKKSIATDFKPWDIEAELNPETYIRKGFIDLKDDCAFSTMVDAANCFGNNYKKNGIWSGGAKHPKEPNKLIWFPKLYKNGKWNNSISNNENEIREISSDANAVDEHISDVKKRGIYNRIVFARVKGPLGDIMYRFKGEYQLSLNSTNNKQGLLWKRVSKKVNTYKK